MATVHDFIEQYIKETEKLIMDIFPQKVFEMAILLQEMIKDSLRDNNKEDDIPWPVGINNLDNSTELSPKKRKDCDHNNHSSRLFGTTVKTGVSTPCNSFVSTYSDKIKPLLCELKIHATNVRMWITYLTPKIEDGDNFGVSIQEQVVNKASLAENEAINYLTSIATYFVLRAKIVSKSAKYPNIEDYRRSVKEADETQMFNLRNAIEMLMNRYASLHDVIMKNIDKIREPKTDNIQTMY